MQKYIMVVTVVVAIVFALTGCGGGGGGNGGGGDGSVVLSAGITKSAGGESLPTIIAPAGASVPIDETIESFNVFPVLRDEAGKPVGYSAWDVRCISGSEFLIAYETKGFFARGMKSGIAVLEVTCPGLGMSVRISIDVRPRSKPVPYLALAADGRAIAPSGTSDSRLEFRLTFANYGPSSRFHPSPKQLMPDGSVIGWPVDPDVVWSLELSNFNFALVGDGTIDFMLGPTARVGLGTGVKLTGIKAGTTVFEREAIVYLN